MMKNLTVKTRKSVKPTTLSLLVFCALLLMNFAPVFGQNITVKGLVTDSTNGDPLPGVSVVIVGSTQGTSTDFDGKYEISVPKTASLLFSFMGFQPSKVEVKGKTELNVGLALEATMLNEVVAIGYGTVQKKDLTGSVSSVSEKALRDIPVASAAQVITGRLSGVQVTTTEGSPDAEIKIRVRGGGSISQDNSPLYVVDGFQVSSINDVSPSDIETFVVLKDASSTAIYGARGANGVILITTKGGKEGKVVVNYNNYYGFRQITKVLDVLSPYEFVRYQHELDQSSVFESYYGKFDDLDIYKADPGTNWQAKMFGRKAAQQSHNLSVSGGNKTTKFNLSLTRNKEESIMLGSDYERNNLSFKLNSDISSSVSFDFNTRLSFTTINGAGVSSGSGATTRLRNSVKYAPTRGLRGFSSAAQDEADITSAESVSLLFNPIESASDEYKQQNRYGNNFAAAVNWKILPGLTFRTEWGYSRDQNRTDNVWGPATSTSKSVGGSQPVAKIESSQESTFRNSNVLTYTKKGIFEGHDLTLMVGEETVSSQAKTVTSESRFFPLGMSSDNILAMMRLATQPQANETYIEEPDHTLSYFGRANYSVNDIFLFQFSMRADASSRFAVGNQWGYFPSASAAVRLSEMSFLKSQSEWLSNLKFRLSYGTAGNNRIGAGLWKRAYQSTGERGLYPGESESPYLIPSSSLPNPKLKWETTYSRDLGLDFGLFNNRISGTIDLYLNTTKDLLLKSVIPTSSGYPTQYQNQGQTSNRGFELSLDGMIIDNADFSLSAAFNISFNHNKIDKFDVGDGSTEKTYSSGWNGTAAPQDDYIVRQGEPIGQMFGYVSDGMYSFDDFTFNRVVDSKGNQTSASGWVINEGVASNNAITSAGSYFGPGAQKFKDLNNDGKIDSNDRTVIGNANPVHTGGFSLTAIYKDFDFSAFFNWSYGADVYNANKIDNTAYLLTRKYQNLSADMDLAHRFTSIDPLTGYNVFYGANANPDRLKELNNNATIWHPIQTSTPLASWAIEDGSFLRVNNVTLGYTLPKTLTSKVYIQKLRVFVTAYNLYTFTKYSGFDPEVDTRRSTPLTPGVDYSAYPKSMSFIGGVNITF